MSHHDHSRDQAPRSGGALNSRTGLALLVFLAIGGLLLFSEHQAHVLGAAVWLLPLVCIVMHMFMHRGHGGHGQRNRRNAP
jgi:hypothetical protein